MTIVVFDGKNLVADSMCGWGKDGDLKSTDNIKIDKLDGFTVPVLSDANDENSEVIHMTHYAAVGTVTTCLRMVETLKNVFKEGGSQYGSFRDLAHFYRFINSSGISMVGGFKLVLVGTYSNDRTAAVHMDHSDWNFTSRKVANSIFGSGNEPIECYANNSFDINFTAKEMVHLAGKLSDTCGGPINILNVATGKLTRHDGLNKKEMATLAKKLTKYNEHLLK